MEWQEKATGKILVVHMDTSPKKGGNYTRNCSSCTGTFLSSQEKACTAGRTQNHYSQHRSFQAKSYREKFQAGRIVPYGFG